MAQRIKKKERNHKGFFALSKGKLFLAAIIYLPFLYAFISQSSESLLYFYFPAIILSVLIAVGLYKIGLPIFYEKFFLNDFGFRGKCSMGTKCSLVSTESFTGLFSWFVAALTALYVYLISSIIFYSYYKLRKK